MLIPNNLLQGKKILLGVTGSIASYKSLELLRQYTKAGAKVKVVMSEAAQKFITTLPFETLSKNVVLSASSESWASDNNHIKAAQWADVMVIAPCSANTIAKLSNGIADNLLTQCALAFSEVKLIAPSANTNMLENPIITAALKMLKVSNYEVIEPQVKELACETVGNGAMADVMDIFYKTAQLLLKDEFWSDRRVIVTGGGTIEKIDDVRYLSNFSSGKMASALASALYLRGADPILIATRFDENIAPFHTLQVESSTEMQEYLVDAIRIAKKGKMSAATLMDSEPMRLIQKRPYLFMAAAVSDYVPEFVQCGKLKKELLGSEWALKLKQNLDILESLDRSDITTVAFKAEMDATVASENAKNLLHKKGVEAVCLNLLKDSSSFGSDDNEVEFITPNDSTLLHSKDKLSLSLEILDNASRL